MHTPDQIVIIPDPSGFLGSDAIQGVIVDARGAVRIPAYQVVLPETTATVVPPLTLHPLEQGPAVAHTVQTLYNTHMRASGSPKAASQAVAERFATPREVSPEVHGYLAQQVVQLRQTPVEIFAASTPITPYTRLPGTMV